MKKLTILLGLLAGAAFAQSPGINTVTVGAGTTPVLTTNAGVTIFQWTLGSNAVHTPTFSSAAVGAGVIEACQNGTGGSTITWTSPFVGFQPMASTAAGYCQYYSWEYNGTSVIATSQGAVTKRSCDIVVGDTSGSAITDAQLGPQKKVCKIPSAGTVVEVDVDSDAGTPSVIVARRRCTVWTANVCSTEVASNLLTGALSVASGSFEACSKTTAVAGLDGSTTCAATLQNTPLNAGDWIELVSGTAGGTAKLMTVHVIYYAGN